MATDRPQPHAIESVLAVADMIAKHTCMQFVIDDAMRKQFLRSQALLELEANSGQSGHWNNVSGTSITA